MSVERVDSPRSERVGGGDPVVGLAHVWTVARGKETLQVKTYFQAPHPDDERRPIPAGFRHRNKPLLDAETVLINWREAIFSGCGVALQLKEDLYLPGNPQIRLRLYSLFGILRTKTLQIG